MSCICSAALARAPGEPGVLTAIGADSAPGAHRGSGRLAVARSATAAIVAKMTMASVMVGLIEFFISASSVMDCGRPQTCLVWTGPSGTYGAVDSDGVRLPPDR